MQKIDANHDCERWVFQSRRQKIVVSTFLLPLIGIYKLSTCDLKYLQQDKKKDKGKNKKDKKKDKGKNKESENLGN